MSRRAARPAVLAGIAAVVLAACSTSDTPAVISSAPASTSAPGPTTEAGGSLPGVTNPADSTQPAGTQPASAGQPAPSVHVTADTGPGAHIPQLAGAEVVDTTTITAAGTTITNYLAHTAGTVADTDAAWHTLLGGAGWTVQRSSSDPAGAASSWTNNGAQLDLGLIPAADGVTISVHHAAPAN